MKRDSHLGSLRWWALRDSNPRSFGYEPSALTTYAKGPHRPADNKTQGILESKMRFELTILALQTRAFPLGDLLIGRSGWIRTSMILFPKQVGCQYPTLRWWRMRVTLPLGRSCKEQIRSSGFPKKVSICHRDSNPTQLRL